MGNAVKFKFADVARQKGEQARLKIVQGPDYGAIFVILGNRATIGRGEENDIIISDLKASRHHAEMLLLSSGWAVQDKSSANGILVNGKAVREGQLRLGDTVTLGETTLEFVPSDASTQMLVAPPKSIEQIQQMQKDRLSTSGLTKALGISSLFGSGNKSTAQKAPGSSNQKRILLILGVIVLLFFMLSNNENSTTAPAAKKPKKRLDEEISDFRAYLPQSATQNKAAETFFKEGLREFFAGNYSRARTQFETALQISPGHALATLYLENCDKAVQEEVKRNLTNGKKDFVAGKLREAKGHFENVMRLLFKDESNPAFKEAKDQYDKVVQEMQEGSDY